MFLSEEVSASADASFSFAQCQAIYSVGTSSKCAVSVSINFNTDVNHGSDDIGALFMLHGAQRYPSVHLERW